MYWPLPEPKRAPKTSWIPAVFWYPCSGRIFCYSSCCVFFRSCFSRLKEGTNNSPIIQILSLIISCKNKLFHICIRKYNNTWQFNWNWKNMYQKLTPGDCCSLVQQRQKKKTICKSSVFITWKMWLTLFLPWADRRCRSSGRHDAGASFHRIPGTLRGTEQSACNASFSCLFLCWNFFSAVQPCVWHLLLFIFIELLQFCQTRI